MITPIINASLFSTLGIGRKHFQAINHEGVDVTDNIVRRNDSKLRCLYTYLEKYKHNLIT